jgi:adenylate cyclase
VTLTPSEEPSTRLTLWQRLAIRKLRKEAGRRDGEPLAPEDWVVAWRLHEQGLGRIVAAVLRSLPRSPRCAVCGAPFAGVGGRIVRPLGYRPSRKNPTVCATCVEYAPPGGIVQYTGVLFADLRGFTERFAGVDPSKVPPVLRRFYRCAEDVLFPDAIIDKLIGDEVMALYLPDLKPGMSREEVPRLQAHAGAGEVVLSERVAKALPAHVGSRVELVLKGKHEPEVAYRLSL